MHRRYSIIFGVVLGSGLLVSFSLTPAQDPPPFPKPAAPELEKGIQVENRGPVHEAFAQPGAMIRGKDMTAPKAPPPPVPELPPDEKPDGANVVWIKGYWQWDAEKKDFLWVSGFWRNAPEDREWQAGQWTEKGGQHLYIPGFWKEMQGTQPRTDLPEPPKSVEEGPNVPAPHGDAIWTPGCWIYRDGRYAWRPGYWAEPEEGFVWQPPQYCYSGSGYRWVSGYWDYCLEDRGLLFAPVYFTRPLWLNAGWSYRPSYAINIGFGGGWSWGWGGFYSSFFIGPGWNSCYFGDYFSPWYWGGGYRPWWYGGGGYQCPLYRHYCYLNRNDKQWDKCMRQGYVARTFGVADRPPRGVTANNAESGSRTALTKNSVQNFSNLVSRAAGPQAGKALEDRVARGQTIAQVNQAVKNSNSLNLVQPAKQVQKSQQVARSLPTPTTASNDGPSSLRASINSGTSARVDKMSPARGSSLPSLSSSRALGSEEALRNRINHAVRTESSLRSNSTGQESSAMRSRINQGGNTISSRSIDRSAGSQSSMRSFSGGMEGRAPAIRSAPSSGSSIRSAPSGGSSIRSAPPSGRGGSFGGSAGGGGMRGGGGGGGARGGGGGKR